MKVEKNKIVFASVLAVVLIFVVTYSFIVIGTDDEETENLKQTLVPELELDQKEYDSKLDAINDLKEVRETNAPSIYDEKLIDSLGFYDADLEKKEKERIVDSIYASGRINYSEKTYQNIGNQKVISKEIPKAVDSTAITKEIQKELKIEAKKLGLEHQLFFASAPAKDKASILGTTDLVLYAVVDGNQIVKTNYRLRMRLMKDALIGNKMIPKNTPVFGFISFQPNRALIEIENINHQPVKLKAFDLQDGSEGIYVENSFREEVTNEVLDDVVQDINIPSVPQFGGITRIFRRNNRSVKVTVLNNYKLILKPQL